MDILHRDLIASIDGEIDKIKAEHAAKGLLRSGATIKRVMREIQGIGEIWYQSQIEQCHKLPFQYHRNLEAGVVNSVSTKSVAFKDELFSRLASITKFIGQDNLYERVIGEVQKGWEQSRLRFENEISAFALTLKNNQALSGVNKAFLLIEAVCLLVIAYLAGLWTMDQKGNYEPFIILLSLVAPFLEGVRRFLKR